MSNNSWERPLSGPPSSGHVRIGVVEVVDTYPLTPMQQAMLLRSQRDPHAGLYVQQFICTLREPLRLPEFRSAWQRLAARHPALRMSFLLDAVPEPLQRVHARVEIPWSERDWRDLPGEAQEEAMQAFLREDRSTPFDLEDPPLVRFTLFHLGNRVYRLVWTSHHVLFDGYARRILLREVFEDYEALLGGRDLALADRSPYGEYVRWLHGAGAPDSRAFWERELRGFGSPNEIYLEQGGGCEARERYRLRLSEELTTALQCLAQRGEITLNTVLQGAWALLLSRYTGDPDVVFGATRACRRGGFLGAEGVVGLLSNTVPVRAHIDVDRTVAEHLESVRALWVRMRPYERTSLASIQEWSEVSGGIPLFQTILSFEPESVQESLHRRRPEWRCRTFDLLQRISYPLAVVAHGGASLSVETVYDPARYSPEAIRRLGEHLTRILYTFAENPGRALGHVDLLAPEERRHLLEELNPPAAPYPRPACIHDLLGAQAARTPDAVAVRFGEAEITYRELEHRSNQLAHALRKRGIGPEVKVGVCMERSLELVVALAGTLKAGGAYVPLDPDYPEERLAFVLEDVGVSLLICQEHLLGRLPEGGPARLVAEPLWAQAAGESFHPPEMGVQPENLAYVIYTSGSTGRPKGAMNAHGGVVNRLLWMQEAYGLTPGDVVLQKTPYSFDVSVWEFFWPLMTGARLVLAVPGGHRDPAYLREVIEREGITTLHFVPSMLATFLEAGGADGRVLRRVVCSGEALPFELQERFFTRFPGVELHNLYGPTEAAVDVTFWACRPGDARRTVPIGQPVANTRTYVLDARLDLVPRGVPGELYLGGVQVGRGYLAQPGLTAERFLPDPFSEPGSRMYRTGDRARWLPDGMLDYLGRVDQQVKIRGFRIEPGELEAALREHPGVREAVVTAREVAPGDLGLVAYVVPAGGVVSGAELRAHLAGHLPAYMVPAAFVALDAFPLTPSGKLDRLSLPAPEAAAPDGGYAPPRTPTEEVLVGIFCSVLGVERVGTRNDFFALGGHSLLAARVAARVREALGVELPLHALFDAPTAAELGTVVESLRAAADGARESSPIPPAPNGVSIPLSFAQERLWFIHRMDPGSAAYNIPLFFRLEGPLDAEALRWAVEAVVRRHETLRTVFREKESEPRQHVLPPAPFPLPRVDLSSLPDGGATALRLAEEEARRPFDLEHGPLLRARLVRLGPRIHLLLASLHHVAADGWSVGILTRELEACYAALAAGAEPELPPLPVRYADYAAWQRKTLNGEHLQPALAYWREHLAGAEPLVLPTDRGRPENPRRRGERLRVALPGALVEAARAFAREAGATPYMVLLAGFKALLSRHGGGEDVVVGTPVAGRERPETEGLVGFFVNTLALRTRVALDEGFRALLARVRETTLAGYAHQDAPYERVAAALQAERGGGAPLFRVMFAYNTAPEGVLRLPGLNVHRVPVERGAAKFDLMLSLEEGPGGTSGAWEMDRELFDRSTLEALAARFVRLLEGALAAPDAPLGDLPVLTEEERDALLAAAAGPACPVPGRTFASAFAAQAARTPGRAAVEFRGERLTYAELDRRASRVARALRGRGVGPETRVGLCVERGVEAVVGMVGILKAGGAYVPLDSAYPAERLSLLAEACGIRVVLAQERTAERLPAGVEALPLDGGAALGTGSGAPVEDAGLPESAAYVIHTSGSTGTPKGVVVEHRSLLNLGEALRRAVYGRRSPAGPARVAVNGPFTFDTSVKQLVQLLSGSTLCVVPEEVRYDARALAAWLRGERVQVLDCTPAQLRLLLEGGYLEEAGPALTDVLVAGEAVDEPTWRLLAAIPGVTFHNLYGPTECTVDATACAIRDFPGAPSIGVPLPNVRTYVLDGRLCPAPIGVPGELYVGGAGVARGYQGLPALTAERFLPDPFAPARGARMYRTGDRVRLRRNRALEFLGRVDDQLKVRGFRIEPGEIEAALRRHPGVRQAVVAGREAAPGDLRLVAYVVPAGGKDPSPGELRGHLAALLPAHLMPSAWVVLDALPLSRHGKVDRRTLPAPDWGTGAGAHVAPRTSTEQVVAQVWGGALGVERVGAEDDFFALGGHSLLVARVAAGVREALGVDLPLRVMFDAPTVARTARWIDGPGRDEEPPPPRPLPRAHPLPLSFAQQRLWFLDRLEPGSPAYNIPGALRLRGALDVDALGRTLEEVVRRHETLRTVYCETDHGPAQVVAPHADVTLTVDDLSAMPSAGREAEALRRAQAEAEVPFDLETGPLFRARLLRITEDDHLLVLTLHHIAGDGWSRGLLHRELEALYAAFTRGEPSPLPELPLQYADLAVWQRETLAGERLERQVAWWRERLAGIPASLELPSDRPRPAVRSRRGGTVEAAFPASLAESLRGLSRREGATLFMTLLAAWQLLLARYSGQETVVVGTPVAGRIRPESEGLIGFFANTLTLRADFTSDPSFRELLAAVRAGALGAYAHQEVPFERLVEELAPARSLSYTPLFQAMFALQSAPSAPPRLPGVKVEPVRLGTATAKFDLTLSLAERDGGISGVVEYAADLFDPETVKRMLGHLGAVLESVAAAPETRVSEVDLLGAAERRRLLVEWNDTARAYPAGSCVHELFEVQARRAPHAVAVVHGGERVTYAELDRRANRLAHALRRRGVRPEARVGVCAGRTPEMLIALLAVLKAGGAYVPLDPAHPRERLAHVLEDASATLVLTERALADRLPAGVPVLVLDAAREEIASGPDHAPESGAGPENLAYLIFTSGSTGRPKGVMIRHAAAAGFLHWVREAIPDEERAAVLGSTSITFDVSVAEIFGTLCWGGTLVLVENALELASVPESEEVRLAVMVPTAAAELLRAGGIPSSVRAFNLAGEALSPELARGLYALGHVESVRNLYGPTEYTTYSTWTRVEPEADRVLIGRPLANTRAYVLDGALGSAPIGVPGELYLAGEGLARGYAGRPDLTAERFLPCPFGPPGSRMYGTGDRVRRRADGELEYLGRVDFQLKVRGFRIEPGEIECALEEHPDVQRAVVVAVEAPSGRPGDRRLVAYHVPREGAPGADELRAHLGERVPAYMVPFAFVALDTFPLTGSGKVDRGRLPAPELSPERERHLAPRTPVEAVVATAFAETLGVPRVGLDDNFFALGGHSLLAVRLVSRIRRETGIRVPLGALFSGGTVERLAALLDTGESAARTPLVAIRAGGPKRPFFCVHAVDGQVLSYHALAGLLDGERPFYGLQAAGVDGGEPRESVAAMAAAYVAAIREVQPAGPYLLGGWSMGGVVAFEAARQLRAAGEAVDRLVLLDVTRAVRAPDPEDEGELRETALREMRAHGLPNELDREQREALLRVWRAHLRALRAYHPEAFDGRALLLRAAEHAPLSEGTRTFEWGSLCAGGLEVRTVPGSHFSLLGEPHVREVAERLRCYLEGTG